MIKTLAGRVFDLLPRYSNLIYEAATRYVDRFNGDNNIDFRLNGEARFLRSLFDSLEDGVIFDIGANIGEWSLYCQKFFPLAHLHLFEPSVQTYNHLKQHKWSQSVYLNNFGFGEKKEKRDLNVYGDFSGMNSLHARRGVANLEILKTEQIEIRTVDEYCCDQGIHRIDFMKVDVEGNELSVFKGSERMLAKGNISIIQFEYGGCNLDSRVLLGDIWELLEAYGYKLAKIYPDALRYFLKYDQRLECFKYSNWVAIKKY